jgi:hypothetical protein
MCFEHLHYNSRHETCRGLGLPPTTLHSRTVTTTPEPLILSWDACLWSLSTLVRSRPSRPSSHIHLTRAHIKRQMAEDSRSSGPSNGWQVLQTWPQVQVAFCLIKGLVNLLSDMFWFIGLTKFPSEVLSYCYTFNFINPASRSRALKYRTFRSARIRFISTKKEFCVHESGNFQQTSRCIGPPLSSGGQSHWLQIQRFRIRFPTLSAFVSGTGSTQPREDQGGDS